MSGALAAIIPPLPADTDGRCWQTRPVSEALAYGCCSNAGPPWIAVDKPNEDFAFAVEIVAGGEPWLLVGVADGVSGSTWGERGAQHAAAAFLETVVALLAAEAAPETRLREQAQRQRLLCQPFTDRLQARFDRDSAAIVGDGVVHPSWDAQLYRDGFLSGPEAAVHRQTWFQTTLLAGALGPRGGFALLLGDGFVRVDRATAGERRRSVVDLPTLGVGDGEGAPVSRWLVADDVDAAYRSVAPRGADELALLLATDGVTGTPGHGLDRFTPADGDACRRLLDELAARPAGQVQSDNMSIAFARCRVRP